MTSITFIRGWQGRAAGSIDSRLPLGIMKTLVQFGTARFTDQAEQKPKHDKRNRARR